MTKMLKVSFRNLETKDFPEGITYFEIAKYYQKYYNFPILVARVDNEITRLSKTLEKKCVVDFYDRSSVIGNSVYASSMQFILVTAFKKISKDEGDIIIQNSIDNGVYCQTVNFPITRSLLKELEVKMKEIINNNYLFTKLTVSRLDAIAFLKRKKNFDKVNVLKYISNTTVSLYRIDDFYDYFFSEMAYSTNQIDSFKLTFIKNDGFVLSYPNIYYPDDTLDYCHKPLIAGAFAEYSRWGKMIGINTAADLNLMVSEGKYNELIRLSETYYESQLSHISDMICENRKNIKVVLIAGPSCSGKTTTTKKLAIHLESKGFKTHNISVDDYLLNRGERPLDNNGEEDWESIRAIDTELFNRHLAKILSGEKVLLPEFNFVTGKREYKKNYLQLEENGIIIIEGLHGLNDDLTLSVERKNKFKIAISPFTQLNIDNHNRIHTSDTRRLRRIIRDNRSRDISAADTLRMWKKVREGEQLNIFPYQNDVDVVVNTALMYELGVLKTYAEPLLFSVSEDDEVYPEAIRLINILRNVLPIPSDDVPKDSVLREFIGGSGFYN